MRALVVDDDRSVRISLREFLNDYGFDAEAAGSAEEALAMLAEAPFDVAIVDLRLPEMSGDAMILKASRRCPGLRFIIHTGSLDYRVTPELERIGVRPEHVFHKPLKSLEELIAGVRHVLEEANGVDA